METVQPIKITNQIAEIKKNMLEDGKRKEYLLFVLGINSGLRISDILQLKWQDVQTKTVVVKEHKTGKTKKFPLNKSVLVAIGTFSQEEKPAEEYIFASNSNRVGASGRPWTRQYAYVFLNEYAREAGVEDKIGTHTLRKTFGYFAYMATNDIALVQKLLNHSSPAETLRYIGITQLMLNNVYIGLNL